MIRGEQGEPIPTTAIEEVMPTVMAIGNITVANGISSVIAMSERQNGIDLTYLKAMISRKIKLLNHLEIDSLPSRDEPTSVEPTSVDGFIDEVLAESQNGK